MSWSALGRRGFRATIGLATMVSGLQCTNDPGSIGQPHNGGTSGRVDDPDAGTDARAPGPDAPMLIINLDARLAMTDVRSTDEPTAPTMDSNCGMLKVETVRVPANVLLVVDRSLSMTYSISGDCSCTRGGGLGGGTALCPDTTNCSVRWDALKAALQATLEDTSYVSWGLKFFASATGGSCNVTPNPEVAIATGSATAVAAQIANATPNSNTPTAAAINAATAYLKTLPDTGDKFILLATDGEPNCGAGADSFASDMDGAREAVSAALAAGFPVYVVGIGPSLSNLNELAQLGGTKNYYPATSPEQLSAALSSISKLIGSCSFMATEPPPDSNNIAVYVNKQRIAADSANGWTFGATPQEILLTGSYCQQISAGVETAVEILFGCPGAEPFPPFVP